VCVAVAVAVSVAVEVDVGAVVPVGRRVEVADGIGSGLRCSDKPLIWHSPRAETSTSAAANANWVLDEVLSFSRKLGSNLVGGSLGRCASDDMSMNLPTVTRGWL
jgi:hypothetical protein